MKETNQEIWLKRKNVKIFQIIISRRKRNKKKKNERNKPRNLVKKEECEDFSNDFPLYCLGRK